MCLQMVQTSETKVRELFFVFRSKSFVRILLSMYLAIDVENEFWERKNNDAYPPTRTRAESVGVN